MIESQPKASGMVEKKQGENDGKRYPDGELLINRNVRESIENKKTRHRDHHSCCIVDVDGADEIALLPFELQPTMEAIGMHSEWLFVQRSDTAARTFEPQPAVRQLQQSVCHVMP